MPLRPYLAFAGTCREAFTQYQQILGGDLQLLTFAEMPEGTGGPGHEGASDAIMHASLTSPVGMLLGADDPTGGFDGHVRGMCVCCAVDDPAEAQRVFEALAGQGEVQMPIGETFFSPAFGMCIDRFGIPWIVTAEPPAGPAAEPPTEPPTA